MHWCVVLDGTQPRTFREYAEPIFFFSNNCEDVYLFLIGEGQISWLASFVFSPNDNGEFVSCFGHFGF